MSYQKCPLCKGKKLLKLCPTCLGERIINEDDGLPPSKHYVQSPWITPYVPTYPTYPWNPNYPIITYMGENISCGTTIGANNITATYAKPPFTFTN